MPRPDDQALDTLFRQARTHYTWQDRPVEDDTLRQLHDLARWGPTSANTSPMRLVFVKSPEAKARLLPCVVPTNVEKVRTAPVCAIVAIDSRFHEEIPFLFPHNPAFAELFTAPGKEEFARVHALRNGSLQGAYLILAARALGLDTGPLSGFDPAKVDAEFFPDGRYQANFLLNLGYGDPSGLYPRGPRFAFDQACQIV